MICARCFAFIRIEAFEADKNNQKENDMAYRYPYDEERVEYKPPKLKTDRKMWKLMLFSFLTLGIYSIYFFSPLPYELEKILPSRGRQKLMNYGAAYFIAYFTFAIVMVFWQHELAKRVEEALTERGIAYDFNMGDFWGWYFFGSFFLVGPYIYFHKLCTAMNLLCEDYNKESL